MNKIHSLALCLSIAGPIAFSQQLIVLNNGTQLAGRFDGPETLTRSDSSTSAGT